MPPYLFVYMVRRLAEFYSLCFYGLSKWLRLLAYMPSLLIVSVTPSDIKRNFYDYCRLSDISSNVRFDNNRPNNNNTDLYSPNNSIKSKQQINREKKQTITLPYYSKQNVSNKVCQTVTTYRPTPCPEKRVYSILSITFTNVDSFVIFDTNHPDTSAY